MNNYRDQGLIKRLVKALKKETAENQEDIRKELVTLYREAQEEVAHINNYTAPEEVRRRNQSVYYYQDLFAGMSWELN